MIPDTMYPAPAPTGTTEDIFLASGAIKHTATHIGGGLFIGHNHGRWDDSVRKRIGIFGNGLDGEQRVTVNETHHFTQNTANEDIRFFMSYDPNPDIPAIPILVMSDPSDLNGERSILTRFGTPGLRTEDGVIHYSTGHITSATDSAVRFTNTTIGGMSGSGVFVQIDTDGDGLTEDYTVGSVSYRIATGGGSTSWGGNTYVDLANRLESISFDADTLPRYTLMSGRDQSSSSHVVNGTYLNENIVGGSWHDQLNGGDGDDVITGGGGNDTITGGAGDDTIVLTAGGGHDIVMDFSAIEDEINTDRVSDTPLEAAQVGSNVRVTYDSGHSSILFRNVDVDDIRAALLGGTAQNSAPVVAQPLTDQSVSEDSHWRFRIPSETFSDADGDTLTLTARQADGSGLPDWLHFNASSGRFNGTPPPDFHGTLDLEVIASDAEAEVATQLTLTIVPENDAPTLVSPLTNQTSIEGQIWQYDIPADVFTDVDGDQLTLTAGQADGTALPDWLTFDSALQRFTGTPPEADGASLTLRVTASDGQAAVTSTFSLAINEHTQNPTNLVMGTSGNDVIKASYTDIHVASVGNGNDRVEGGGGHDMIFGLDGDDQLFGGDGNDRFFGGDGADHFDGGNGHDAVIYAHSKDGVQIDLTNMQNGQGTEYGDTYTNIETLRLSNHDDTIVTDGSVGRILAATGDDVIVMSGRTQVYGNGGMDTFVFERGADGSLIRDFSAAEGDKLDLSGWDITGFDDDSFAIVRHFKEGHSRYDEMADLLLLDGHGQTLETVWITSATWDSNGVVNLTADDFIFG